MFPGQGRIREPKGLTHMKETYSCIVVSSTADPNRCARLIFAEPFRIYHLHIQHKRSDAQAEFRSACHVDVYGIKQEVHGRFLDIRNSSNIRVHGYAGIGGPYEDSESIFWIDEGSSDILIANIGDEPQFNKVFWGGLSPRNRLWRANVLRFPAIQDDTHGLRVTPARHPHDNEEAHGLNPWASA
jgi:hypothetical protein